MTQIYLCYIEVMEKLCSKCQALLPICSFNKDNTKPDGHYSSCKNCRKQVTQAYYLENTELLKQKVSSRQAKIRASLLEQREKWLIEHAEELEASRLADLETRREKHRVRERARYNANPERGKARCREQRKKYPEKARARQLVSAAIQAGTLIKSACEVCGKLKVEAHHEDYSKPLSVRWLCSLHHGEAHRSKENSE